MISPPRRTILIASFLEDDAHWASLKEKEPSMTYEYDFEMVLKGSPEAGE